MNKETKTITQNEWLLKPTLIQPLQQLEGQQYFESHEAFENISSQRSIIMRDTIDLIVSEQFNINNLSILSPGCGSGSFDKILIKHLIKHFSSINYIGIDPNEIECNYFSKRMSDLPNHISENLKYKILTLTFEKFKTSKKFDIILFIQVFHYFDNVSTILEKSHKMLKNNGIILIFNPPCKPLNMPYSQIESTFFDKKPTFSNKIEEILNTLEYKFRKKRIDARLDITNVYTNKIPKNIFDFIIYLDSSCLSKQTISEIQNYLKSITIHEDTKTFLPHPVDRFVIHYNRQSNSLEKNL